MTIEKEMIVVAVHGEGDRATVNALQKHRNAVTAATYAKAQLPIPPALLVEPDEPPEVMVVLHDPGHSSRRVQLPLDTWDEVEELKRLVGWDADKRHWQFGRNVKVVIAEA